MDNKKSVTVLVGLLILLLGGGTLGYSIILEVPFVDALYMTVITISTVGFQEIREMGPEGKIFSMVLIFMSIGTVGYLVSNIISMVMEGEVKEAWRVKKMEKEIRQLKDHYIICGQGKQASSL